MPKEDYDTYRGRSSTRHQSSYNSSGYGGSRSFLYNRSKSLEDLSGGRSSYRPAPVTGLDYGSGGRRYSIETQRYGKRSSIGGTYGSSSTHQKSGIDTTSHLDRSLSYRGRSTDGRYGSHTTGGRYSTYGKTTGSYGFDYRDGVGSNLTRDRSNSYSGKYGQGVLTTDSFRKQDSSGIDISKGKSGSESKNVSYHISGKITKAPSSDDGDVRKSNLHLPSLRHSSAHESSHQHRDTRRESQRGRSVERRSSVSHLHRDLPRPRSSSPSRGIELGHHYHHHDQVVDDLPRKPRRTSSLGDLSDRRTSVSPHRDAQYVQGADGNVFPVCGRWPNCSVCTIDIPNTTVNKEQIMRTMKAELKEEIENIALIEKKEKEIQTKAERIAVLTQESQRKDREIQSKSSEINRKDMEIVQLKSEIKTLQTEKRSSEQSLSLLQVEAKNHEHTVSQLTEIQAQYEDTIIKNKELIERIKNLEIAEKEFIDLERNVIDLQDQIRDMEEVEVHRDELYQKLQVIKRQRDDFLQKGKLVEEERNNFLRTSRSMEQHLEDFRTRVHGLKREKDEISKRVLVLEREKKEIETTLNRNTDDKTKLQSKFSKLEVERDEVLRELREVTTERNILEQKLAECEDMLSDHDQLEEGFHSLRLKLAELTRQRDDAEMLIPSFKAKTALLKRACREKDETITKLKEELDKLKHSIATSAMDDMAKIKTYGYSGASHTSQSHGTKDRKHAHETDFFKTVHNRHENESNLDLSDDTLDSYTADARVTRRHTESLSYSQDTPKHSDESVTDERHYNSHRYSDYTGIGSKELYRKGKKYTVLFDYDPYKSSTSDHPEDELRLKEGDYITVYGEMDVDGYVDAEANGTRGKVPSIYVEETKDGHHHSRATSGQHLRRQFICLYDYDPYTMGTTARPDLQLSFKKGDLVTVVGDVDVDGYFTAEYRGRRGLVPSNFVQESSQSNSLYHQSSSSFSRHQYHSSTDSNLGRSGTKEFSLLPQAPQDVHVVRVVNKDSLLLSWSAPDLDTLGKSNGCRVLGYRIFVNGKHKHDVMGGSLTKVLIDGLNLNERLDFDVQTIGENSNYSEKCHMGISEAISMLTHSDDDILASSGQSYRLFMAIYDYDPYKSSPNPNPSLELGFKEGDLIRIFDTTRSDGFFQGEMRGKRGLVPSNFIEEIAMMSSSSSSSSKVDQRAQSSQSQSQYQSQTHSQTQSRSRSQSIARSSSEQMSQQLGQSSHQVMNGNNSAELFGESTSDARRRRMVAMYDYDPVRQSPAKDKSKEIPLKKGQSLTVLGDMRPDGFFLADVNGKQGLVPGDFLEVAREDEQESQRRVQFASSGSMNA